MSSADIGFTMGRIEAATPLSPIAVFHSKSDLLPYDSMFASTVKGKIDIRRRNDLIGIFHNEMDLNEIRSILITKGR